MLAFAAEYTGLKCSLHGLGPLLSGTGRQRAGADQAADASAVWVRGQCADATLMAEYWAWVYTAGLVSGSDGTVPRPHLPQFDDRVGVIL